MNKEYLQQRREKVSNSKTFRNIVKRFDLSNKKVLDIGCGYGEYFIHFGKGSLGVTLSKEQVLYSQQAGERIVYGDIEEDFITDEIFDCVWVNNLFEHLESPYRFLIKVKKFLSPDGILILGVPCVPKISALMRFKKFRGCTGSGHLGFYTRKTLKLTVEAAGWEILEIRGFRLRAFDKVLNLIYPHFYIIAKWVGTK